MNTEYFFSLTPDRVLDAVEAGGTRCTGLCYALNSLENRVYELELDDRSRVVAKFYRPGRWSDETILDEHRFLQDLEEAEIPVCPPLPFPDGATLRTLPETGIRYALFPKVGGRAPDEFTGDQPARLGRLLGRIHNVGASRAAPFRFPITPETYGRKSLETLEALGAVPLELRSRFRDLVTSLLKVMAPMFEGLEVQRIHGDCHPGNLLWGSAGPFFLDFDDMVIGPAVQDIWMLVPGRDAEAKQQRDALLEGYCEFRRFERKTLELIEPLRALRFLRYCAWVTQRWQDPAFPNAFPHYGTPSYWEELMEDLEEQLRLTGEQNTGAGEGPSVVRPEFTLRFVPVNHDDFQRILTVRDEVFVEEMGLSEDSERDGLDSSGLHLLAENEKGLAAGVARIHDFTGTGPVRLSRLAVLPAARGQGVGRALVKKVEEYARMMGAPGVAVDTPTACIPFFGRLDYLVCGKAFEFSGLTLRPMLREWGG